MNWRRLVWVLIVVSTTARLVLAASVGPLPDEAYHYLFTVYPDWSYFDHPPMLALVEGAGLFLTGGGATVFGLRVGFVALFAGSTWLMARLGARVHGERAGFIAALLLNATGYYGIAAGTFALPDGPLLFFWLLTLLFLHGAVTSDAAQNRGWNWIAAGLAWGGAMLSKYLGVFLPIGMLCFLIWDERARAWLSTPWPYVAVVVGLIVFSPVIAWNAAHGWASFAFQGGRAVGGFVPNPKAIALAILGQAGYVFPWIWVLLLGSLFKRARFARGGKSLESADRFLVAQALPPFAVFFAIAAQREVLPHWSLVGFLPLMPLAASDWAAGLRLQRRGRRRVAFMAAAPVLLTLLFVAQARWGLLRLPNDPTLDLFGWDQVARELEHRSNTVLPNDFVFTGKWYHSGQLALATQVRSPVLCYNSQAAHGFAHWSRPEHWRGKSGILVVVDPCSTQPAAYEKYFQRIESLGGFDVRRRGVAVRHVRFYRCERQLRPFPFEHGGQRAPDRFASDSETRASR